MKRLLFAGLLLCGMLGLSPRVVAQSGPSLPGTCTLGQTFTYTAVTPNIDVICSSPNVWTTLAIRSGPYAMPDNAPVNLFTVPLTVVNEGCAIQLIFSYRVTNGTQAALHTGFINWSFINQGGTVSSNNVETGQTFVGTGCGGACDVWNDSIAGTTATGRATFNNTLSVTGLLTYRILNSTCALVTPL